jgi:hypothetical protein
MTNVQKILISVSYKKTKLHPIKKSLLTLLCLACISHFCFSQNSFPSSGTVGIGTSSPNPDAQLLHIYRNTTSKEPLLWLEDDNTSGYSQMEFHATGKIFRVGVGNSDALATYANKFYIVDAGIGRPRLLIGDEVRCRSVLPCSTQRAVANSLYIPYFQYQRSAVSAPGQHVANGNRQWQSALPRCQWKRDTGR